jgi:alpha-tubulin suppressor-like RCC1 family protein
VTGVSNATAIAAGEEHSCALLADGTVKCWGYNSYGQIGDNTTTTRQVPTLVLGIDAGTAIGIWAGPAHSCALMVDGTAKCWGQNIHGQLGDGTTTTRPMATAVSDPSGVVRMALGGDWTVSALSCAILVDGTVRCWGDNAYGQVGDFSTTDRLVPTTLFEFP